MPTRPRNTPIEIAIEHCDASATEQISTFFKSQVDQQLSCLSQANQDWGKRTSILLRNVLAHIPKVTVTCRDSADYSTNKLLKMAGFSAVSSHAGENGFPLIDFNRENSEFKALVSENRLQQLLFHETLHWTGTQHFSGPDIVYLGEICCGAGEYDSSALACDLLSRDPGEWDTAKTQTEFHRLLEARNIAEKVRLQTTWSSWRRLVMLGNSKALAEADLILDLLRRIAPEKRLFWDGVSGQIPAIPHSQHLLGLWVRSMLRSDQAWLPYARAQVSCVELVLNERDLAELLWPVAQLDWADRSFLRLLGDQCTKY